MGAAAAGALALSGGCSSTTPPGTSGVAGRRPNIIFILADDLGYGDVGCFGQKRIKTPHLDQLAADGVRFTQAYAGSPVCAPSRCCLMTGLHTGHARIRGNKDIPLAPEDRTVASLLKEVGYATGLVGKWGLGEPTTTGEPRRHGFDEFYGYLNQTHAHNSFPPYLYRNESRVSLYPATRPLPATKPGADAALATMRAPDGSPFSNDLFTTEAIDFITRHANAQPFFLYLSYTIPHANSGTRQMEVPDSGPYAAEAWPEMEKRKAAAITRMDAGIGQLLAQVAKLGITNDTMILFTSDNGPHKEGGVDPTFFNSSGPLRGIKRDLYEGGIRVPTIARWPGHIAPGTTNPHAWAFSDFLPTAADLAGAKTPAGLDGLSFAPSLMGKPSAQKAHTFLYWEFHERGFHQAVRMGHWKGIRHDPKKPLELYDLSADLSETTDVALQHPAVVKQIEAYLATARTVSPYWPEPLKPATRGSTRSLRTGEKGTADERR